MTPARLSGLVAVLLLATGSVTACGEASSPSPAAERQYDAEREWRLSGDKNATADEIIDAGRPADVAASGDQTLITWLVNPEDDEGPTQGAWRLYDAHGKRVADGKLGIVFEASAHAGAVGVDDGFLIENYTKPELIHVAPTGKLTAIPVNKASRPTQAGDLLLRECCEPTVYRPADHTAYDLPPMPTDQWQAVGLDETGKVWVMLPWARNGDARIAWSQGGAAPWTTEVVDLPSGSAPTIDMALVGGELMFPQISATVTEFNEYQAIWRRSTATGDARWRSVPLDAALLPRSITAGIAMTDGGRLLVPADNGALLEQADGSLRALRVPGNDSGTYVQPVGDLLYANGWPTAELYVSDDLGKTWTVVER